MFHDMNIDNQKKIIDYEMFYKKKLKYKNKIASLKSKLQEAENKVNDKKAENELLQKRLEFNEMLKELDDDIPNPYDDAEPRMSAS